MTQINNKFRKNRYKTIKEEEKKYDEILGPITQEFVHKSPLSNCFQ